MISQYKYHTISCDIRHIENENKTGMKKYVFKWIMVLWILLYTFYKSILRVRYTNQIDMNTFCCGLVCLESIGVAQLINVSYLNCGVIDYWAPGSILGFVWVRIAHCFVFCVVCLLFSLSSSCILCTQCCQSLWIVHYLLLPRFFLTFI